MPTPASCLVPEYRCRAVCGSRHSEDATDDFFTFKGTHARPLASTVVAGCCIYCINIIPAVRKSRGTMLAIVTVVSLRAFVGEYGQS